MEESYNRCTKQSKTNSALTIKSEDNNAGAAATTTAAQTSNVHAPNEVGNQHENQPLDPSPPPPQSLVLPEQHRYVPMANVVRIMRRVLPTNAKISDDAKETVQVSVSKYINFITRKAKLRCQQQKRKIVSAEDIIWALGELGFDDYVGPISMFKDRYLESHENGRSSAQKQRTTKHCSGAEAEAVDSTSLGMGNTGLLAMGTGPLAISNNEPLAMGDVGSLRMGNIGPLEMGNVGPQGMGDVGPLGMGNTGPLAMGSIGSLQMGNVGPLGMGNTGLPGIGNTGPLGMGDVRPLWMGNIGPLGTGNIGPIGLENTGLLGIGNVGPLGMDNIGPPRMGDARPLGMNHVGCFRMDNAGPHWMGNTGPLGSNGPFGSIGPEAHKLCPQQPCFDPLMMNPYTFENNNSDLVGASSSVADNVLGADPYAQHK